MAERAESAVRVDDVAFADIVDLALLKHVVKLVALLREACGLNLSAIVEEIDREELALALGILPGLDVGLVDDTGADSPLVLVWREAFDGIDSAVLGRVNWGV